MTARTYDPFAIDRPKLRLGEHGEWELGEMHDTRDAKYREVREKFFALTSPETVTTKGKSPKPPKTATISDFAAVVGELVSVACIDADEAKDILIDLCDSQKHGDEARGMQTLTGIVEFLAEYASGELSVGEG